MIIKTFPDIRSLWEGAFFGMLEDQPRYLDYAQRNIIQSFQNHLIAKSAVFDFDLGDIGLTQTKWSKFTGQYVDVESLYVWINNSMNVKSYDSMWNFKMVKPNFGGKKAVHQWGNCLLGYSFRRKPGPPTLTLFTRTQAIDFAGVADYALTHFVAKKIAERMGIDQSKIRFQVYCPNLLIKMVAVIHTLHRFGRLDEFLAMDTRVSEGVKYYYEYIQQEEKDIKWRAAKRYRTKYFRSVNGVYRSMPVDNLSVRGWDNEVTLHRVLTSRQASSLVLGGEGRREVEVEVLEV